jgi:hypothetical protein
MTPGNCAAISSAAADGTSGKAGVGVTARFSGMVCGAAPASLRTIPIYLHSAIAAVSSLHGAAGLTYPLVARYKDRGSTDDAAIVECQRVRKHS